jgi:hypothetical protein
LGNQPFGELMGLWLLGEGRSRSICAENHTGGPGEGGRSTNGAAIKCAKHLGVGWKVSPFYEISPGEELCLADITGSGKVESIWFGGNISRNYILRFYWDNATYPAVECPLPEFFAYGWQEDRCNPMAGPFY